MSRKNKQNIKKHNDKLHKAEAKLKKQKLEREAKLREIIQRYNDSKQHNN